MRFAIAATLLVGLVAAGGKPQGDSDSVLYSTRDITQEVTYTHCPSYITDCPAESKTIHVVTSIIKETTTYCPEEASATAYSHPPPPPPTSKAPCADCVVTLTKSWSSYAPPPSSAPYYPVPHNTTTKAPIGTGTGSPTTPSASYYSNAANHLSGGALAIGAGALALLAL